MGNIYHCFYDSDTGDLLSSEVTEMTLSFDFDEDNIVSTELMESVYIGMTEADMFALIGYPSQSFGEEMRLVYYTDDGAKYLIRRRVAPRIKDKNPPQALPARDILDFQ